MTRANWDRELSRVISRQMSLRAYHSLMAAAACPTNARGGQAFTSRAVRDVFSLSMAGVEGSRRPGACLDKHPATK